MILMHQLRLVLLHTCVKLTPTTIMVYYSTGRHLSAALTRGSYVTDRAYKTTTAYWVMVSWASGWSLVGTHSVSPTRPQLSSSTRISIKPWRGCTTLRLFCFYTQCNTRNNHAHLQAPPCHPLHYLQLHHHLPLPAAPRLLPATECQLLHL